METDNTKPLEFYQKHLELAMEQYGRFIASQPPDFSQEALKKCLKLAYIVVEAHVPLLFFPPPTCDEYRNSLRTCRSILESMQSFYDAAYPELNKDTL